MVFNELDFIPVLLGSDINTYSMARAFNEEYSIKSIVIGKYLGGPSYNSRIVDYRAIEKIDEEVTFIQVLNSLSVEYKNKKLLLIGCGDSYVSLICKNKKALRNNFIAPYISYEKLNKLIEKDAFYEQCKKYDIQYPKTFVYNDEMKDTYELGFDFPVIVKPADSVEYWRHPFDTQTKVYKIGSKVEFKVVTNQIYAAGYRGRLIVQDYIPGDDSYMRVLTCYSDQNGKVKLMALGHVLLEEHTPHGLGNHSVIINDYNEKLMDKIKSFLENIGYVGFSNFDIKYDIRDNEYKVFEINVRQGRSNYYVTAAGDNIARYVVEDFVYGRELEYKVTKNKILLLMVPRAVAFMYVASNELKQQMRDLIKQGNVVNPVFYKGDYGLKRLYGLLKTHISHFSKYYKYYR